MTGVARLAVVGVMGSGSESHRKHASRVGRWLAAQGVHLLTGAGGGAMTAVSQAFYNVRERRGCIIGILPGTVSKNEYRAATGYPNPWVEIAIRTHLPLSGREGMSLRSRNHINVLTSDVIIALPGSAGTASEVALALRYSRPLVAYLVGDTGIDELPHGAYVESDWGKVKQFVLSHIATARS